METNRIMEDRQLTQITIMPKSLLILTPKGEIIPKLKELAAQKMKMSAEEFDDLLIHNTHLLENHSVPVLITSQPSFAALNDYIIKYRASLLELMLSQWPFSIKSWGLIAADMHYFDSIAQMIYFPIVFNMAHADKLETRELAVTCFGPTKELGDFLIHHVTLHKDSLGKEYLDHLELLAKTGVALLAEGIKKSENQSAAEFLTILSDPRKFLRGINNNLLRTLFNIYFEKEKYYPTEIDDQHLGKWFKWHTYVGVYADHEGSEL